MVLTKEQILAAADRATTDIEVLEWGGTVRLRSLSGAERDRFEASVVSGQGRNTTVNMQNMRAKLVALSAVGDDGNPLFTEADVKALGDKSAKALNRLFEESQKLSGLSDNDVKDLAENFSNAQSDGSTSA